MSGHSKWATIKRQKGRADALRGQLFTKLSNAISIAAREGGAEGESNFKLRLALDRARAANMPKETIERAIEKGSHTDKSGMREAVYEGFGPGGVTFIAEAATDNTMRTTSELRSIVEKHGGTLAAPGAVSYQYQHKGMITVEKNSKTFDDIFLAAAEFGAEDVEDAAHEVVIYTKVEDLKKIKDEVANRGFAISDAELTRKPLTEVEITNTDTAEKILSFMDRLESHDDVQKVYSNFSIPDILLTRAKK